MKKCMLTISLLFAATANAAEEVDSRLGAFHTVASLVEMCTSPNPASLRYCYGYVTAVADTINTTRVRAGKPPCIPGGVTLHQVIESVIPYLQHQEKGRDEAAAMAVAVAIGDAWNCR
jgi:hypothetical protein